MSMKQHILRPAVLLVLLGLSACTMKKQEAPELAGPSEFGTAITITITPDTITQDGASQSIVTATARGTNGEPLANLPLRAEIRVNGVPTDFGSLSARTLVTGADGRATLVYTAPAGSSGLSVDEFTVVDIGITPIGSNFGNSVTRFGSLRLVPRGTIVVPSNLQPAFTFAPTAPGERQTVLFDASLSTAPANNPIVSYSWNFDDGTTAQGRTVGHAFNEADTYIVTLTVSDALGRVASTSQGVGVTPSAAPSANFVFSPSEPTPGSTVLFNALTSTAAPGRQIVAYSWDFGDPGATANNPNGASGAQTSHRFGAGNFNVTLTVTDDLGRTNSASRSVDVK
jgi:PKD repeat protein